MHRPVFRAGHAGFTLLELLVVMVIIGMLAAYVAPRYFAQVGKSETKLARAQIDALEKVLDQYRADIGHYPSSEQGLAALMGKTDGAPSCFATQWFRFARGLKEDGVDSCAARTLGKTFLAKGQDIRELMVAVVLQKSFLVRRP